MPGRRIVLLSMPTEDAEEFVRAMQPDSVMFGFDVGMLEGKARVEAVVAQPLNYCKCSLKPETRSARRKRIVRQESSGWSRGKRFGWWLHSPEACRKPSKAVVMHFITTMLAGANDLLPQIIGSGEAISPQMRWERDGGVPNEHANANNGDMPGVNAPRRRKKARRSEIDRARVTGGTG